MTRRSSEEIPRHIPSDCEWVDFTVLGEKSIVDSEFIKSFRRRYRLCLQREDETKYDIVAPGSEERVCFKNYSKTPSSGFLFMYKGLFSKLGVGLPFTDFEIGFLRDCNVAPSQLHPNSWGFLKAFQAVCRAFNIDCSLRVFYYLFNLTKPFSKEKPQWLSIRAQNKRKVLKMYQDSVKNFKNSYFKIVPRAGVLPFWADKNGYKRFPLYWCENWEIPKVDKLEGVESMFVEVLMQCWGKKGHHLSTKMLLTETSSDICTEIEKMTRSSDAYKRLKNSMSSRAQEPARISGKTNSTASPTEPSTEGGTSANSELEKTPNSLLTLTEQDIIPAEITEQRNPKSRKRKAFKPKYGSVSSDEFDHVGFAQEYLLGGSSRFSMEGDDFQKNLEFATKYAIKIAALCHAAQNKVKGCVVVPHDEVSRLRTRVASLEEEKHFIESEKFTISGKVMELEARLALGTRELEGLKETLKKVEEEKLAEHEKHKTVASKSIIMIEENKKLNDENKKLYYDLKALEEERILVSKDALVVVRDVVKNLKEQIGVICPDFNVDLLSPDHEVVDGKIVDDKGNEVSEVASKEPSLGKESMLGKERN